MVALDEIKKGCREMYPIFLKLVLQIPLLSSGPNITIPNTSMNISQHLTESNKNHTINP